MLDINGSPLLPGRAASLLCEILAVEDDHVRVRVMNSELEIAVGAKHDEVLGGLVADSELTAFEEQLSAVSTQPSARDHPVDVLKYFAGEALTSEAEAQLRAICDQPILVDWRPCKSQYHDPDALYCLRCIPPDAPLSVLLIGTRKPTALEIAAAANLKI